MDRSAHRQRSSRDRTDRQHDKKKRSRLLERLPSPDSDNRHKRRRRNDSPRRRRHDNERHDDDDDDSRRRHHSPSSPDSQRRNKKKKKRKRRGRRRRHEHDRRASPSPARRRSSSPRRPLVSDDEQPSDRRAQSSTRNKRDASSSSRDDTFGHFRGGPGTIVADRFKVIRDVGLGTFGRVVECYDLNSRRSRNRAREGSYVAIKIVRDVKRYHESAVIEASVVEDINHRRGRGLSHCAMMYDAFTWNSHYCMVFESLGPSLYDFSKRHHFQPFPMICLRDFTRQLLEALEFLHGFRLIHTDLKPENILLMNYREVRYKWNGRTYQIPESTKIKLIDFGGATYDNEKKSSVVSTRQYRAPEVILGLGWSMPADIWSAGCILAELYLGELLFATHDNHEHLALMERIISLFPRHMLKRANNRKLVEESFHDNGRHRLDRTLPPESASYVLKTKPLEAIIRPEDTRFRDILRMLLTIDPNERPSAHTCLRHGI